MDGFNPDSPSVDQATEEQKRRAKKGEIVLLGDSGGSPVYLVHCKCGGLFIDYPHGYEGFLECIICQKKFYPPEELKKAEV